MAFPVVALFMPWTPEPPGLAVVAYTPLADPVVAVATP
jgi:hypothetical protein